MQDSLDHRVVNKMFHGMFAIGSCIMFDRDIRKLSKSFIGSVDN